MPCQGSASPTTEAPGRNWWWLWQRPGLLTTDPSAEGSAEQQQQRGHKAAALESAATWCTSQPAKSLRCAWLPTSKSTRPLPSTPPPLCLPQLYLPSSPLAGWTVSPPLSHWTLHRTQTGLPGPWPSPSCCSETAAPWASSVLACLAAAQPSTGFCPHSLGCFARTHDVSGVHFMSVVLF